MPYDDAGSWIPHAPETQAEIEARHAQDDLDAARANMRAARRAAEMRATDPDMRAAASLVRIEELLDGILIELRREREKAPEPSN